MKPYGSLNAQYTPAEDQPSDTFRRGGSGEHSRTRTSKALVIDDSDTARVRIATVLRRAGYTVFELPSAIGATRMALREQVDVAIVDISMPGLSGDKLVGVLRCNARLDSMAIIVVSGHAEEHLSEMASNPHVDAVLSKSKIQTDLLPLVQRALLHKKVGNL